MTYSSLWEQAQGKTIFEDDILRCTKCGKRIKFGEYVDIVVWKSDKICQFQTMCKQHGGKHTDCCRGIEIDLGKRRGRTWIFLCNLVNELWFWFKTICIFIYLVVNFIAQIILHPMKYRKWIKELE